MKVIGKSAGDTYICEVSHTELEKLTDRYYGQLQRLEVGQQMNLGKGYDFRAEIKEACRQMVSASEKFYASRRTLTEFAAMVANLPDHPADKEPTND